MAHCSKQPSEWQQNSGRLVNDREKYMWDSSVCFNFPRASVLQLWAYVYLGAILLLKNHKLERRDIMSEDKN